MRRRRRRRRRRRGKRLVAKQRFVSLATKLGDAPYRLFGIVKSVDILKLVVTVLPTTEQVVAAFLM
jgi:hypothetical protein